MADIRAIMRSFVITTVPRKLLDVDEVVAGADSVMYSVKNTTKRDLNI